MIDGSFMPQPAKGTRCERCWRYTDDVGQDEREPRVCLRCAGALEAIGYFQDSLEPEVHA